MKFTGNGAAATGIVALDKREQFYIGEIVSGIEGVLWCNIIM
jgi:hypothetical protein